MGKDTKISWTDMTYNPHQGCRKISPGCENCEDSVKGAYVQENWPKGRLLATGSARVDRKSITKKGALK